MATRNIKAPLADPDKLPDALAAKIGRVMMRCSEIEYHFLVITKRLLNIGIAEARLLFANGRWTNRLQRLVDIARIRSFDHGINVKALNNKLDGLEVQRNMFAHEAIRRKGATFLGYVANASRWQPDAFSERVTAAEEPREYVIDDAYLDGLLIGLDDCLADLRAANQRSRSLLALSKSSRARKPPAPQGKARTPKGK